MKKTKRKAAGGEKRARRMSKKSIGAAVCILAAGITMNASTAHAERTSGKPSAERAPDTLSPEDVIQMIKASGAAPSKNMMLADRCSLFCCGELNCVGCVRGYAGDAETDTSERPKDTAGEKDDDAAEKETKTRSGQSDNDAAINNKDAAHGDQPEKQK